MFFLLPNPHEHERTNRRDTQQGREPQGSRTKIIQQQPEQQGRESLRSPRWRGNKTLALAITNGTE
jgi:hypothetical protein